MKNSFFFHKNGFFNNFLQKIEKTTEVFDFFLLLLLLFCLLTTLTFMFTLPVFLFFYQQKNTTNMMLKNAEEGRLIKINTKQNCYNYINFFIIFYTKKKNT